MNGADQSSAALLVAPVRPSDDDREATRVRPSAGRGGISAAVRTTAVRALGVGVAAYLATKIAFVLCLWDSKVSLVFPPYAVMVAVLLFAPVRQWWAFALAAVGGHRLAAWQSDWPFWYWLHCEAFDVVKFTCAAAGIRLFTKAPLRFETLREAGVVIAVAAVIVPFATAFWGAAFTVSNGYGTDYWVEWRNLWLSNAVTAIALLPGIILGVAGAREGRGPVAWRRLAEAALLAAGLIATGLLIFGRPGGGPDASPALLYAPVPLLIWAAIRFGPAGTSAALLIVWVLAIWEAMHGRGPFLGASPTQNTLSLQFFFLVNSVPLTLLAVVVREARNSQARVRESEAQFRAVTNGAPVMIWKSGPDKGCTFFNDVWLAFTGRTAEQERGDGWAAGVHPEDLGRCLQIYTGAFDARRDFTMEYRLRRRDGEYRWVLDNGVPRYDAGGAFQGYVGACVDVTDGKRTELELQRHRAELAHLSRVTTMGELSGSMAHELNQPLTAIRNNAQAALRFLSHPVVDLDEVRESLRDIIEDDVRAADIIQRLRLLFTKGEVRFQPLDVNQVIAEVLKLLYSDLLQHAVGVDADLAVGLGEVQGDRVQLQQVLINLILNACDAMADTRPAERRLSVRTGPADGGGVRVWVGDRGCGIAADRLETVFTPFVTTKAKGMGLGLAVCRTIVTAHGGRLWAETNVGGGATFVFTLPAAVAVLD